jgi:hypothetical protein
MSKKTAILTLILVFCLIIVGIILYEASIYMNASKYPTGKPFDNLVIYKIDPETILNSLESNKTEVFAPATSNPLYDDVPLLWPAGSLTWNQKDYINIANALHKYVWEDSLENWHPYSESYSISQCIDVSRINAAYFQFYNRQKNWYYLVHAMTIDSEYGYVYAGDNDSYYTGKWKDIDIDSAVVNNADKALLVAEQNGGQDIRLTMRDDKECHISISLEPFAFERPDWGWRITYWLGSSPILITDIDPYTGEHKTLNSNR